MPSDLYTRDFTDARSLILGGRIDLRLFQDIPNAGDGMPGLQRAMKNWAKHYLHDGLFENDLDLNSHNIRNLGDINERVYYVTTDAELDNAIADITANTPCSGKIIITDSLTDVQVTINAANCSFVIEGNGDATVLDAEGNNTIFTITNCTSCVIRDLKADGTNITTISRPIILINEASNNKVSVENVNMIGPLDAPTGIEISSENCTIKDCYIETCFNGIYIDADNCVITGNKCNDNSNCGIVSDGDYCVITGNKCTNNDSDNGIFNQGANNTIVGNQCDDNGEDGIHSTSVYNTITGNTCNNNTRHGIQNNDTDNTITGNNCNGNGHTGIYNTGGNSTITGNTCNDCTSDGIWNNANETVIVGNCCMSGLTDTGANTVVASNNDA